MSQNIIIGTGRLIEEVRCRPLLWDSSDEFYKNKDAKNKAWEEVGEALFGEHYKKKDIDKLLRLRWKSARDGYFKTKSNIKNTPSGSGAKTVKKYIYFEELKFLDRTTENVVSESLDNTNDSSSLETQAQVTMNADMPCSSQNSSTTVTDQDKPTWARKRKNTRPKENSTFEKQLVELLDKNMPDISSDDLAFFNSLGPILKSFNSYEKNLFRSKVLQIAMDISGPNSVGTTSTSNFVRPANESNEYSNMSPENISNSTIISPTSNSHDTATQRGYRTANHYYNIMSPENDSNSCLPNNNVRVCQTANQYSDIENDSNSCNVMSATVSIPRSYESSYFSNLTLPDSGSIPSETTDQDYQCANQNESHSTVINPGQQSCEEINHFRNTASETDNF